MNPHDLDALVAQARGVEPYWAVTFGRSHCGNYSTREEAERVARDAFSEFRGRVCKYFDEPRVSTDIEEAMELVEEFVSYTISKRGDTRVVNIHTVDGTYVAESTHLPEAICLAYLKAKGVEVLHEKA
jgi:hypothetical protein